MSDTTGVHSANGDTVTEGGAGAWSSFTEPASQLEFYSAWLALLCAHVRRARAALLLVADADTGAFAVAAAWPDPQRDMQYLGPAAQRALTDRRGIVEPVGSHGDAAGAGAHVAYPIVVDGRLSAAVVIDVEGVDSVELQRVLREVHWGSAWLLDHFRAGFLQQRDVELERVASLNELLSTALQHAKTQPSALAVANDLVRVVRCDRVSIGFERAGRVTPLVLSHTSSFDSRSDLVRLLGDAMDEVLDLGVSVAYPAGEGDELGVIAHAHAARGLRLEALLSVPLATGGDTVGVITLERALGPAFDESEQRLVRAVGVMLGPVWAMQRANERGVIERGRDALRAGMVALLGPGHPGLKLLGTVAALLLVVISFVTSEYRVSSRTVIEGATQTAVVAPFEGYLASAMVRAGDSVRRGQALARLEDRDLRLERARVLAERDVLHRRLQVAMATGDRSAMRVHAAQALQADAQLALTEEKLARATLIAPFDGLIVSGDLSQQIGSPVERGKLLFELAPLRGFRVVLQVDDRDIARLAVGQRGELVLSSLPSQKFPYTVSTITPVASQIDGRNVFRVEALLQGESRVKLRPGMEGIGKTAVGERRLLWIWTHSLVDWLRISFWNWMP